MKERAGRWAIRDVVIDGVSVAANYRAQFLRIMQSSSYQELVRQMRARVPETLTGSLVATAIADEAAIVSVSAAGQHSPSDSVQARKALAPRPPRRRRRRGRWTRAIGRALAARSGRDRGRACPARSDSLADECGAGRAVGDEREPIAPRPEARSQPHRRAGGGSGPRPPRTASPTGCRSAPSRAPRRPGAWPPCSSSRSLQARADRQPSWSRGRRTFC